MDLYIPRKCVITNRLIVAKDHASVQFNIGHVDAMGRYNRDFTTCAVSGFIRGSGDSDAGVDHFWAAKLKAEKYSL